MHFCRHRKTYYYNFIIFGLCNINNSEVSFLIHSFATIYFPADGVLRFGSYKRHPDVFHEMYSKWKTWKCHCDNKNYWYIYICSTWILVWLYPAANMFKVILSLSPKKIFYLSGPLLTPEHKLIQNFNGFIYTYNTYSQQIIFIVLFLRFGKTWHN